MKRLLALLLFGLGCCLLPVSVFAENKSCYIEEIGMTISVPEEFIAVYKNGNDPQLAYYGLDNDELYSSMVENGLCFDAIEPQCESEITVAVTKYEAPDEVKAGEYLSQLSDAAFEAVAEDFIRENKFLQEDGYSFIFENEIYCNSQARFVQLHGSTVIGGETLYSSQYFTITNDKAINIGLVSYTGEVSQEQEQLLREIVDSVSFDIFPTFERTGAYPYTISETGASFTVPANWKAGEVRAIGKGIYSLEINPNTIDGEGISLACADMREDDAVEKLLGLEWMSTIGEATDNSAFDDADIADLFGCDESSVFRTDVGGKEYFYYKTKKKINLLDCYYDIPIIGLFRCDNGFAYHFKFGGSVNGAYIDDFIALVESFDYSSAPAAASLSAADKAEKPVPSGEGAAEKNADNGTVVLAIIAIAAALIIAALAARNAIKKKSGRKAEFETYSDSRTDTVFCCECGGRLAADGKFCPLCGARVRRSKKP